MLTQKYIHAFKSFFPYGLIFYAFLIIVIPANAHNTSSAHILENNSLKLTFQTPFAGVSGWEVKEHAPNINKNLILAGDQLILHGTIASKSIEEWTTIAGGWQIESSKENALYFRLSGSDLPFVLEKRWELSNIQWQAHLQISITPLKDIPDIELSILLGPGIGERPVRGLGISENLYSYTEIIYHNGSEAQTFRFEDAGERKDFTSVGPYKWVGLHSRYFLLMLVNASSSAMPTEFFSETPKEPIFFPSNPAFETRLSIPVPLEKLENGKKQNFSWKIFGGGKSYQALKQNDLQGMLYNSLWQWMRWLTIGIGTVLYAIQSLVVNWGVAIILLALVVRILIYPLAKRSMVAQKEFVDIQKKIQPEIQEIKRSYKGGEQSERILMVYERYRISPFAGLKPLLIVAIQIPIFMALFHLLGQAFELRNTPFLWIDTLAEPDKLFSFGFDLPFFGAYFNLLPLLMSLTNLLSIKIMPSPVEAEGGWFKRNISLILMAIAFFLLFYSFPAGMVLYWAMANVFHVLHTLWMGRSKKPKDGQQLTDTL
ncbi:YidC/Oxa1 family insertase periplasmic-domain containing protein [Desulfococcaceae bacterium OttesenSCG-928-F15]|nr:YidC/Oxa1 family insertase periplasmic-domain containing protein [Desulfococcaceae bacterium OttesenSCG-928-F15]